MLSITACREDDSQRNDAFLQYDLYDHALAKNPCPWGHEIYNVGKTFRVHHYYALGLSES